MPLIETVGRGNVGKIPGKWRKEGFSGRNMSLVLFLPFLVLFVERRAEALRKNNSPRNTGRRDGRTGITRAANTRTYMGKRKGKGGEIFQSGGAKCPLFLLFFKGNGGVGGHKREWETPDGGKCFEEEGPRMSPGAFFSFLLSTSYILVLRERGEGKGAKNDTLMPAEFLWEMDGRRRIEMLRQTPLLEMRQ